MAPGDDVLSKYLWDEMTRHDNTDEEPSWKDKHVHGIYDMIKWDFQIHNDKLVASGQCYRKVV